MNSNIINQASTVTFTVGSRLCCFTQKRGHVRVHPWRFIRTRRECYLDNTKTDYTDRNNINEFTNYKRQKKNWQIVVPKEKDNRFNAYQWNYTYRSDPKQAKREAQSRLQSLRDSLLARGSARESDPYDPPEDVEQRLLNIVNSIFTDEIQQSKAGSHKNDKLDIELAGLKELKFDLITKCIDEFNHHMPSPYLNEMLTVRDIVEYFSTPVRGFNPYASMLRQENSLPPNLSLIAEPLRYDKECDTHFGGYNALPGIISRVPGLRAAKDYPILNQDEFQWPDI